MKKETKMLINEDIKYSIKQNDNLWSIILEVKDHRPILVAMFDFKHIITECSPESFMEDILSMFDDDLFDYIKHGNPLKEVNMNEI